MSAATQALPNASVTAVTDPAANFITAHYWDRTGAAHVLGLKNKRTLSRWEAEGFGPPITRIGTRVLYRKTALLEWLASQEKNPRSARPSRRRSAKRKK